MFVNYIYITLQPLAIGLYHKNNGRQITVCPDLQFSLTSPTTKISWAVMYG